MSLVEAFIALQLHGFKASECEKIRKHIMKKQDCENYKTQFLKTGTLELWDSVVYTFLHPVFFPVIIPEADTPIVVKAVNG